MASFDNVCKFSIIIPTYNRANDLNRCLNSLVEQTFKNFEVIVCDDGSDDNTSQIIDKYANKLSLTYIKTDNWGGPARPRNIGIKASKAEWICFLDSDDSYTNNRLEYLSKIELKNYDLIYHQLRIVKNGKFGRTIKSRQLNVNAFHDLLFNLNAVPTSSTCIRKGLIEKAGSFSLDKAIVGLEDFDLWIRMAQNGLRTKYIPLILGYYYIGDDSITFKDERQINRFKALYSKYINELEPLTKKEKVQGALDYQIASVYIQTNKIAKALPHLIKAFYNGSIFLKWGSIYKIFQALKGAGK